MGVQAQPFTGSFPELGPPVVYSEGVDQVFKAAQTAVTMIMAGAHMHGSRLFWPVSSA